MIAGRGAPGGTAQRHRHRCRVMQTPDVEIPCLRVSRAGSHWTITQRGFAGSLGEFDSRDEALDHARAVAVKAAEAVLEAEDADGRLDMRQSFTTSASGTVTVTTFPYEVFLPPQEDQRRSGRVATRPADLDPRHQPASVHHGRHDRS
jgi:hypothetical protein